MEPVPAEAIRTLYAQIRTTASAAIIITLYMIAVALPFTPWPVVLGWAAVPLSLVVRREFLFRAFRAANPADGAMKPWAESVVVQQALVGTVWGATIFLFGHPDQPLTIALTLCCLYSIGAGSVTSLAYYPRANVALIAILFGAILVRLLMAGGVLYALVGGTSFLFGVTMIGYCRNQSVAVQTALRIRFENVELLKALAHEKTEADSARRRAELASLAKSQFLAAASHDLRQPLYALSLFSASLDELGLDAEGQTVVGNIQSSISVMEALFDGLLDISKLDAGVVQPRFEVVSVDAIFDRLSQVFLPIAIERGIDFRLRSDGEWITSDPVLLEQVLANLVSNALRYTAHGGVLVAARKRSDDVSLEVWDTGRGIAVADLERIFDEFVQIDNRERDRRKGLGLGLAIARRSAALVNASLTVASRPDRGSRFALTQPMVAFYTPGKPMLNFEVRAVPTLGRAHDLPLLIIEDDPDVRTALTDLLTRWDIAFLAVGDDTAACAAIAEGRRFGLILSDYRLADGANGLDLIRILRTAHPAPQPVAALITGDYDATLIASAHQQGIPVLHKPLRPSDLRTLLGLPLRLPN